MKVTVAVMDSEQSSFSTLLSWLFPMEEKPPLSLPVLEAEDLTEIPPLIPLPPHLLLFFDLTEEEQADLHDLPPLLSPFEIPPPLVSPSLEEQEDLPPLVPPSPSHTVEEDLTLDSK